MQTNNTKPEGKEIKPTSEQITKEILSYSERDKRTFDNGFLCAVQWMQSLSPSSTAPQPSEEEQLWAEFDKIARLWKQNGESPLSYHLKNRGFTIQKKQP